MDGLKVLDVQRIFVVVGKICGCMKIFVIRHPLAFMGRQIFVAVKARVLVLHILGSRVYIRDVIIVQRDIELFDDVVIIEAVESCVVQLFEIRI